MPIDDFLLRDETILAGAKASTGGSLYATNKRVIKYEKTFFHEKVDSLYYSHIVAASYESQSYIGLVAWGIGTIIGAIIIGVVFWHLNFNGLVNILDAILILLGVLLVLLGIFAKPLAWYQIKAVGLTETELKLWRTAGVDADAKTFARFIQDQISTREIPTPPPPPPPIAREVITREIVMVKCDYCGGLMPQTAVFCPNCGAKRKA